MLKTESTSIFINARAKRGHSLFLFSVGYGCCAVPVFRLKVVLNIDRFGLNFGVDLDHHAHGTPRRFCNRPPGGRIYLVTQRRNWTLWKFGSTQVAENFSVGIFCQAGKNLHASLRNWPPEGRVYLVTQMRNWTLWEFGSTYVNKNVCVGIFCQAGKNGMPHCEISHQGAEFV